MIAPDAIHAIIADIDRITVGRRRIDIAHACLSIAGSEIASVAADAAAAKRHAILVAGHLKAYVRDAFAKKQNPDAS